MAADFHLIQASLQPCRVWGGHLADCPLCSESRYHHVKVAMVTEDLEYPQTNPRYDGLLGRIAAALMIMTDYSERKQSKISEVQENLGQSVEEPDASFQVSSHSAITEAVFASPRTDL